MYFLCVLFQKKDWEAEDRYPDKGGENHSVHLVIGKLAFHGTPLKEGMVSHPLMDYLELKAL